MRTPFLDRASGCGRVVYHECRACGRTVEESDLVCPGCGSWDIVRYEWEK